MKTTSPVLIICATVVACTALITIGALVALGSDPESVGVLVGVVSMLTVQAASMLRGEQTKRTVDDLANGRMDAKIRAGVADVLGEHLIDPKVRDQLDADREVRGNHA
ncbi:hypothetical protein [Nocardioides alcanivorans]|uniref:hypothetical protein n=1 Tax=Nocardioides alcanivorans TaxID=2897352 RepID=UPI001F214E8A|nr:hypothetical protein [Nocardioides alcanivorans]